MNKNIILYLSRVYIKHILQNIDEYYPANLDNLIISRIFLLPDISSSELIDIIYKTI